MELFSIKYPLVIGHGNGKSVTYRYFFISNKYIHLVWGIFQLVRFDYRRVERGVDDV